MSVARASLGPLAAVTLVLCASGTAAGQGAHEAGRRGEAIPQQLSLQERAGKRWPQPVRVGALAERLVIEPSNRQGTLGRVAGVARQQDGALRIVLRTGGVLGVGARMVGVPIEATTLLGQFVQVTDLDAAQLKALPDWTGAGATTLGPDDVVRIGLNRN